MASQLGHDAAIGSAAMVGEIGLQERESLIQLELARREAVKQLNQSRAQYEAAISQMAEIERKVLHARTESLQASIAAAAIVDRALIDAAISKASDQIRSGSALVVERGRANGWGNELDGAIEKARATATGGEIPAAVVIRGLDPAMGNERPTGVGLFLDLTGVLPQPSTPLSARELARRRGRR